MTDPEHVFRLPHENRDEDIRASLGLPPPPAATRKIYLNRTLEVSTQAAEQQPAESVTEASYDETPRTRRKRLMYDDEEPIVHAVSLDDLNVYADSYPPITARSHDIGNAGSGDSAEAWTDERKNHRFALTIGALSLVLLASGGVVYEKVVGFPWEDGPQLAPRADSIGAPNVAKPTRAAKPHRVKAR